MPFEPKDWKDYPDTSTRITAAALEDLETRVTDYTDDEVATKADASHAHAQSDVTGLSDALATKQSTSEKAQANGYASLDGGGKVPATQLPNSVMEFQGMWNASTNTPTLADGTANPGDVYRVSNAGSVDLGSGSINFKVNDQAVYGADGKWYRSRATDDVTSVAGKTGDVSLASGDVSGLGTAATKDAGAAGSAGKVLNADDASTSNARTPTAHKSSHATGGSDALAPSDIGAAPLDSPTFTGNPQAPTPSQGDNDASVATTAFVQTEAGLLVPKSLVDAKGDLLVGTADNTIARKAVGADGSRLIADSSQSDGLDWEEKKLYTAVKTAPEDVTNSDTPQDDDHLFLTLPTGRFVIDWTLYTTGASTAADWKFGLTGTATSAGTWGPILTGANANWGGTTAAQSPAALASLGQTITLGGANVAGGGFILRGLVYISVAGTLKLQWAQNTATSGVTNTLYTGSCMIGTKVG